VQGAAALQKDRSLHMGSFVLKTIAPIPAAWRVNHCPR